MDEFVMVVIHYRGQFIQNENQTQEYFDRRNKAKAINKTITFRELEDMVYGVT